MSSLLWAAALLVNACVGTPVSEQSWFARNAATAIKHHSYANGSAFKAYFPSQVAISTAQFKVPLVKVPKKAVSGQQYGVKFGLGSYGGSSGGPCSYEAGILALTTTNGTIYQPYTNFQGYTLNFGNITIDAGDQVRLGINTVAPSNSGQVNATVQNLTKHTKYTFQFLTYPFCEFDAEWYATGCDYGGTPKAPSAAFQSFTMSNVTLSTTGGETLESVIQEGEAAYFWQPAASGTGYISKVFYGQQKRLLRFTYLG